jgi:hypothetical protein
MTLNGVLHHLSAALAHFTNQEEAQPENMTNSEVR